jgi:hypothetical protein
MKSEKENVKKKVKKTAKKVEDSSKVIKSTIYKELEGNFLLVRVGTEARPATGPDIEEIEDKLSTLLNDNGVNCIAFVTHHALSMEIIKKLK